MVGFFDWMNSAPQGASGGLLGGPSMPTRADFFTNLGLGLLAAGGPSNRPVGFGSALGQAGLNANQLQRQGQNDAYRQQLLGQQGQLLQSQIDQDKAWREMWNPTAQTPPALPQVGQTMSQPGMRPGPTPQAAAWMSVPQAATPQATETGYSMNDIPAALRPLIGSMGRQAGSAFLAQQAAKNLERGQFIPEDRIIEGKTVPGQRDRLSGKWSPLDPTLTKVAVNPSMSLPPQESEFEKTVGKGFGENYNTIQNQGMTVGARLGKLDRLESLLSKPYTGLGAEQVQQVNRGLKAAGDAFGIDTSGITEKVGSAEAATALANEIALEFRNPSGGAGMPGAMSDQDREFLKQMTGANITTTAEGRKLVIETRRRLIKRDADIAKLARDYYKKNGKFDSGFYEELQQWSDKHPLFEDMKAQQPASPAPAANPYSNMSDQQILDQLRNQGLLPK